jgi:leader peptidase (prepilin peptidase)/N-methyltransferase
MIYFWFITGAVVGSFLNVCIHRLPRGESIVFPPSHCPNCQRRLSVLDLVPVLGYFLILGRCRYCRAAISPRYPVVEFLSAVGFAFAYQQTGGEPVALAFQLLFLATLLVIFFTDLEMQVIPDGAIWLGTAAGLLYNFSRGLQHYFLPALLGMLLGYILLFIIGRIGTMVFKKEALGEGDLYLAACLGAVLGWEGMLLAVFVGYLVAGALVGILLITNRVRMGQYIPLGPALAVGGLVIFYWGANLVELYWQLLL